MLDPKYFNKIYFMMVTWYEELDDKILKKLDNRTLKKLYDTPLKDVKEKFVDKSSMLPQESEEKNMKKRKEKK